MNVRLLFIVGCGVLGLALAACPKKQDGGDGVEMLVPPPTPAGLQKYWTLPDFALTERSGQPLRLGDLAGKVWVADFFFATCAGPCPILTSHLAEVQKALDGVPDVRFVSISVDPVTDTPNALQDYARRFQAGNHWYFCTGDKAAIYKLAHDGFKLPIADSAGQNVPIIHTTRLALVDRTGVVRGFYEGATGAAVPDVVRDIRLLLAEK